MVENRQAIHAYLSEEAHESFHTFAEGAGCSVTGLIEDMCRTIKDKMSQVDEVADDKELWAWGRRAAKIDAERRRRGGNAGW